MLKPPVGNHLLYGDGQLKVMIIAGPNERLDYHVNQGEELYYQVEGQMELKIKEKGEFKSIPIQQDQFFILPGGIPHSPQRFPNSIGIVIERERKREELDGLRWYTKEQTLYEEWFHCTDLGSQLVPVIERFKASKAFATQQPQQDTFKSPVLDNDKAETIAPIPFTQLVSGPKRQIFSAPDVFEFQAVVEKGPMSYPLASFDNETFLFQIEGTSKVAGNELHPGDTLVIPAKESFSWELPNTNSKCLRVINQMAYL